MKQFFIAAVAAGGLLAAGCGETAYDEPAMDDTAEDTTVMDDAADMDEPMPAGDPMMMTANLGPAEGVDSEGMGTGEFTFNPADNTLEYTVTYAGLTGPAGAAHIHGPAPEGESAGVVVPFADAASPITGTATLTDEQVEELMNGMYYVNVHTEAYGAGEIRGQIMPQ